MKLFELIVDSRVLDLGPLPAPRLPPTATIGQALLFLARGRRGAVVVVDEMRPVGIFTERDVLGLGPDEDRTPVAKRMSSPPVTIERRASLKDAVDAMLQRDCRHLVVVGRDGNLKGLLTSNDLTQYLTDQFPEETMNLPPHLHQRYRTPEGA